MAELPPLKDREERCGACLQGFVPRDGVLNIVRTSWEDPGAPICPECLNKLGSRGIVRPDPTKFKCRCGSRDPSVGPCPVHTVPQDAGIM